MRSAYGLILSTRYTFKQNVCDTNVLYQISKTSSLLQLMMLNLELNAKENDFNKTFSNPIATMATSSICRQSEAERLKVPHFHFVLVSVSIFLLRMRTNIRYSVTR